MSIYTNNVIKYISLMPTSIITIMLIIILIIKLKLSMWLTASMGAKSFN